eukprot:1161681-Pelagomonas_calceolata.AAC.14
MVALPTMIDGRHPDHHVPETRTNALRAGSHAWYRREGGPAYPPARPRSIADKSFGEKLSKYGWKIS